MNKLYFLKMKVFSGFLFFLVLFLFCQSARTLAQDASYPNIVYILTDDMGYGDVSAFNEHAAWKTVHMDKLAGEGMIFTDAHSSSAVCTPSRYGILTGRYSWRSRLKKGVLGGMSEPLIGKNRMTVAALLKKHGYQTACVGKWHLGLGWQYYPEKRDSINFAKPLTDTPNDHGFDYSYIIPASLDMRPYVYIENDHSTSIPTKYTVSKTKYGWWRRGLTGDDFVHEQVLPHLTDISVNYIRRQHRKHPGKPFFLYFAMPAPHTPILPTKAFQGKSGTNPYGDYVLEVDYMIGRVMNIIDSLGLTNNTLFFVTSDNGCSPQADYKVLAKFGHNPSYIFRGAKADIFEGGHRVPLIVRWPGKIKAASQCHQTVCLADLMATCAAIVGEKLPDNAGEDSYNMMPLLLGKKLNGSFREATVNHSINGSFALRQGSWKLEMCPGSGGWSYPRPREARELGLPPIQLYNLDKDISEQHNIYNQYPDKVKNMKDLLKKYILEGRSTHGKPQHYVNPVHWPGLDWMKPGRVRSNFDEGWLFHLGNVEGAENIRVDDAAWRKLDLPHDWSIEGKFSKDNPSGRGEGYLPGGIGWYRKYFKIPDEYVGKKIFIEFDGVYMNSDTWINGHHLGNHPYGYTSYFYDLTPYLNYGRKRNVIAVKVDNSKQPNSRWYSGSGIYRHVWFVVTDKLHVAHWGTFVTTPRVTKQYALVNIKVSVKNESDKPKKCVLVNTVVDKDKNVVGKVKTSHVIPANSDYEFTQQARVPDPQLWSPDHPYLYKVHSDLLENGLTMDNYDTPLGIRTFYFDADKGFFLNGKNIKLKGTCNHHDLGPLGAAVNDRAIERQVQILKEMGCNAIRTSHNPPAPELLDYCDQYGLLVMDEAFDEWKVGKRKYGYHEYFDQWAIKDLQSMIRRDRNHPGIILWSVGNEIREQGTPQGVEILKKLVRTVHEEDTTRPATEACNMGRADRNGFPELLDVVGYNQKRHFEVYDRDHLAHPERKIFGSETCSALETRGIYHFPADQRDITKNDTDLFCSAYDNCWQAGNLRSNWKALKERDFVAGGFMWTGWDYIGEPSPYPWPARSSYFGVIDLCGFPKDGFYFQQSQWTDKPMVHILPHWNWPGKEGQIIPVWCYTNCDEVELFLNSRSLGKKDMASSTDLKLSWDVPYKPGTLKAVGYKNGKIVATTEVKTAGPPAKILLTADRTKIHADGKDLSFVTVTVVDKDGTMVPNADNMIKFHIDGKVTIAGVGNGRETSLEPFKANYRKAFNGKCLVILQASKMPGKAVLTATSEGLDKASLRLDIY